MSADFSNVLRDTVVLTFMIALRVVMPLIIIFLVGKWAQKKLEEEDKTAQPGRFCWEQKRTAESKRALLAATQHPDLPCWLALQVSGGGLTEMCYDCTEYAADDLKDTPARHVARDYVKG